MIFSTLAAGVLYGLYCLTLRRDRWLQLNLWYLLVALPFSILVPHLPLPDFFASTPLSLAPAEEFAGTLDGIDVSASSASQTLSLMDVLPDAYLIGLAVCLAWLVFQMAAQAVSVVRLRRKHGVYGAGDGFDIPRRASLFLTDDDTAPYSFFNQIVVGTRGLSDEELRCILAHESHHVRQNHSIDLLFARMLCCMAWFNPFAWLMLRELRAVQEFQADAASLGACGREDYLHLLYRQVTGTGYGHIINNFQSINIKKRIVMMNTKKSRFGAWKVLAALPVVALLTMVGCKPTPASDAVENQTVTEAQASVEPVIYDFTQNAPEGMDAPGFPSGEEAFYKYLSENITYPQQAKDAGIQGRVVVGFVVMDDGSIVNVEVVRGIGGGCDEEAVRVVKAMPKWKPAIYNGKPVNVHYSLPITFKLQ
jgi:TonB family protein